MNNFSYKKDAAEGKYKLGRIFTGLTKVPELQKVFGSKINDIENVDVVLTNVSPFGKLEYAYINVPEGGSIHVGADYIKTGPEKYIYLDIIHELTHIKQHWDGRELFDESFIYVDRPTEIEAYKVAVEAARRIGLTHNEICSYLEVPWCSKEDMKRLEKAVGL